MIQHNRVQSRVMSSNPNSCSKEEHPVPHSLSIHNPQATHCHRHDITTSPSTANHFPVRVDGPLYIGCYIARTRIGPKASGPRAEILFGAPRVLAGVKSESVSTKSSPCSDFSLQESYDKYCNLDRALLDEREKNASKLYCCLDNEAKEV